MRIDSTKLMLWGGILFAVVMAVAQEAGKEWVVKASDASDMLQFTIRHHKGGSFWSSTNDVPRSRFRGLSIDLLEHGGPAKFEYITDAGTLECKGRFSFGRGSGDYTFVPNRAFVSALTAMGYDAPDEEQVFSMMMSGIGLEFARAVKDAGLHATTSDLIRLRNHGVTLEYIADTRAAGYRDLTVADFVELRNHGVSTGYLRDLKSFGFNLRTAEIVELRNHGVASEFLRDLKLAGYNLPVSRITELRNHGVSSQFLLDLKDLGLHPDAGELVQLRDHGVSAEYLKGLRDAGYGSLRADDVVQLRSHGVDARFAEDAKKLGYKFSVDDLIYLRDRGVNGPYLRTLRDSGMRDLNAEQIAKLKMHGVE